MDTEPTATHLDAKDTADVVDVGLHDLLDVRLAQGRVVDLVHLLIAPRRNSEVVAKAVALDIGRGLCSGDDNVAVRDLLWV